MLVVALQPQFRRVLHAGPASPACCTSRPHRGTRRSATSSMVMPFIRSISSMPWCSWMRHQSFLTRVHALREADLLALQVGHPVDVVLGAHHHDAALARNVRHPQEPGPADVRVNLDGREQAAEADQVVEVVDVVRVPVVLAGGAQVRVLDADLLVLLLGPAQFLVHVAGGHQRTVGVVHLFPIQLHRAQFVLSRGLSDRLRIVGHVSSLLALRRSTQTGGDGHRLTTAGPAPRCVASVDPDDPLCLVLPCIRTPDPGTSAHGPR